MEAVVDSMAVVVVFMQAADSAAVEEGDSAVDAPMAARTAVAADSGFGLSAVLRTDHRWAALDHLQVRDRARPLVQGRPAGVSVLQGDRRELAMPSRMAGGTPLEILAA
jgi:hypothetical protein